MQHLLDAKETKMAIQKMAQAIVKEWKHVSNIHPQDVVLVGIRTRGVPLAQRIAQEIRLKEDVQLSVGHLDITLYRDDLSQIADHPVIKKTEIPFSIDSKIVYLIDDVLFTGRTIRCALDALFDFGRPKAVKLGVMVDRGGRELPIQADVIGIHCDTNENDNIHVKFKEIDGEDGVEVVGLK